MSKLATVPSRLQLGAVDVNALIAERTALEEQLVALPGRILEVQQHINAACHCKTVKRLSPREEEVLVLVRLQLSNKVIADRLFVGERTIKFHVSNILKKMGGLSNRQELWT